MGEAIWPGPFATSSAEYRLPARFDAMVLPRHATEIWARVYRPQDLTKGPYPLLVFLHGNHATCGRHEPGFPGRLDSNSEYTETGTCPAGFTVAPSHAGYGYLADRLASWGYVVVSINANRGVNGGAGDLDDPLLNVARGRLILRHLDLLDHWNVRGGTPASLGFNLKGKLDFNHIGLMGHSRGGEGALAAYNLLREAGSAWPAQFNRQPNIEGIFTIAPQDTASGNQLTADDIAYAALVPLCDGDLSHLDGMRVFDRSIKRRTERKPAMKAIFGVWGANHNFYNTEWQQSDAAKCLGQGNVAMFNTTATGSSNQRFTGLYAALSFFRSQIGPRKTAAYEDLFKPDNLLPYYLQSRFRFERSYSPSASNAQLVVVDDFNARTGTSTRGVANTWSGVTTRHRMIADHGSALRVNEIAWTGGGHPQRHYQSNGWVTGSGIDISSLETLEFRIALACKTAPPIYFLVLPMTDETVDYCDEPLEINGTGGIDFSVALALSHNRLTKAVPVSRFATLHNPVGGKSTFISLFPPIEDFTVTAVHPIMQTVRIPLNAFLLPPGAKVRGVRLVFDRSAKGDVYVSNIRFSRARTATPAADALPANPAPKEVAPLPEIAAAPATTAMARARLGGIISGIRRVKPAATASARAATQAEMVEIALTTYAPIPIRDEAVVLQLGGQRFLASRYTDHRFLKGMAFTLRAADYARIADGVPASLVSGGEERFLGPLRKVDLP